MGIKKNKSGERWACSKCDFRTGDYYALTDHLFTHGGTHKKNWFDTNRLDDIQRLEKVTVKLKSLGGRHE